MFGEGSDNTQANYKLYTGLCDFNVVAVNLDKAKLESLGIKREEEPKYVYTNTHQDESGENVPHDGLKIDIYVKSAENTEVRILDKVTFFLENHIQKAQTGKVKYINKYGKFAYLDSLDSIPENMDWFDTEGARPCLGSEELLINFMRNYLNLNADEPSMLENTDKLFKGDVSILRKQFEKYPKNKIKMLCGVKTVEQDDGGIKNYQAFYIKDFLRPYTAIGSSQFVRFKDKMEQFKESGGMPTVDFGDSETLSLEDYDQSKAYMDKEDSSASSTKTEQAAPSWE